VLAILGASLTASHHGRWYHGGSTCKRERERERDHMVRQGAGKQVGANWDPMRTTEGMPSTT
jgi:hypothetical protein